jgi:hypothetical protein
MHFAFLPFCHVVKMIQPLHFALVAVNLYPFTAQLIAALTLLNRHLEKNQGDGL